MKAETDEISQKLKEAGLKVTPQRHAILEAVYQLGNHPTAENVIEHIRDRLPNIATGTVYKVLDILVVKGLVKRVKSDRDTLRYDGIIKNHHHLYCNNSERIEDYVNEELDLLLKKYFSKRDIPGFQIEEIKVQINGTFIDQKNVRNK